MTPDIKQYLSSIGAKGGKASGSRKARSTEQARKAALARWAKAEQMIAAFDLVDSIARCVKFSECEHPERTEHAAAYSDAWIDAARKISKRELE